MPEPTPLTLQDIQRRLNIGAAQAMRVQAALTSAPALTRAQAEQRLTDDVLEHIWRGGIISPTEAEQHAEMRQRLLDALFGEGPVGRW